MVLLLQRVVLKSAMSFSTSSARSESIPFPHMLILFGRLYQRYRAVRALCGVRHQRYEATNALYIAVLHCDVTSNAVEL